MQLHGGLGNNLYKRTSIQLGWYNL